MFDYQHTFSPTLLTDARFAFSRIYIPELQLDYDTNAATNVGIPNINLGTVYTSGLPEIDISDPTHLLHAWATSGCHSLRREANFQFYDNWTKIAGRHSFKCGG